MPRNREEPAPVSAPPIVPLLHAGQEKPRVMDRIEDELATPFMDGLLVVFVVLIVIVFAWLALDAAPVAWGAL